MSGLQASISFCSALKAEEQGVDHACLQGQHGAPGLLKSWGNPECSSAPSSSLVLPGTQPGRCFNSSNAASTASTTHGLLPAPPALEPGCGPADLVPRRVSPYCTPELVVPDCGGAGHSCTDVGMGQSWKGGGGRGVFLRTNKDTEA